jgi:hypothetical protein
MVFAWRAFGGGDAHHPLIRCDVTRDCAESSGVYGAELFDEDSGHLPLDLDLRPERSSPGTARCRRDDDNRSGHELVGPHYDSEAVAVLLMTDALREKKAVDVTVDRASPPSTRRPAASLRGPLRLLPAPQPPP